MSKAKAIECLTLAVKDDLVDIVVEHKDSADAWQALHDQFQSGDTSQVFLFSTKLHSLKISEGILVEEYLKNVRDLKNCLVALGQPIEDHTLVQLVFNGLPRSYKGVI